MVDRARAPLQRDRHRAQRRELLDVRAQRTAGVARDRAHPRQVLVAERDRLDEDVERVDVALARQRLGLVHPGVGGRPRRDGVGEQARHAHRLDDARRQLAPEPRRARLAGVREPVARLALERGRAVREQLGRERRRLREHVLVGRLGERPRRARDAAAGARDLLVGDAGHLALVLLRAPAGERQVRVAVDEARQHRAAGGVDDDVGVVGVEAGDPAAVEQHVAGLERQLARAIVAQVGQPVLRRAQHLRGAADRDAGHPPRDRPTPVIRASGCAPRAARPPRSPRRSRRRRGARSPCPGRPAACAGSARRRARCRRRR